MSYSPSQLILSYLLILHSHRTFQNREIEDFFILASILRLATKYLIANLRRQAIAFLTQTWACTLAGHDSMVERALQAPTSSSGPSELSYPYVHPLHVLTLARETNVRLVVPAALYFLSIYPFSELRTCNHPKLLAQSRTGLPRPEAILNIEDVGNYTLMFQYRIDVMLDFSRVFCGGRHSEPGCSRRTQATGFQVEEDPCMRSFAKLASRASRSWYPRTGPLRWMVQTVQHLEGEGDTGPGSVCKTCREAFRSDVEAYRVRVWEALPNLVGFPGWQQLIDADLPVMN